MWLIAQWVAAPEVPRFIGVCDHIPPRVRLIDLAYAVVRASLSPATDLVVRSPAKSSRE